MKRVICLLLVMLFVFSGCGAPKAEEDYGSFTMDKTYCYDQAYYANTTRFKNDEGEIVTVVDIFDASDDIIKHSIILDTSSEYWGFCWEEDSYNIWVQTAEDGVTCYKKDTFDWVIDENAEKPDYIIEKAK